MVLTNHWLAHMPPTEEPQLSGSVKSRDPLRDLIEARGFGHRKSVLHGSLRICSSLNVLTSASHARAHYWDILLIFAPVNAAIFF